MFSLLDYIKINSSIWNGTSKFKFSFWGLWKWHRLCLSWVIFGKVISDLTIFSMWWPYKPVLIWHQISGVLVLFQPTFWPWSTMTDLLTSVICCKSSYHVSFIKSYNIFRTIWSKDIPHWGGNVTLFLMERILAYR